MKVNFYKNNKSHTILYSVKIPVSTVASSGTSNLSYNMNKVFTDAALRRCVLDNYNKQFGASKSDLTDSELSKMKELNCENKGIISTKGIEKLTGLITLNLYRNNLISINVSKNTKLENLNVSYNNLTSIDLSKNTKLKVLRLYENKLSSINVSKNTKLENLDVSYNNLTSIDLSKNTKLISLNIRNNKITKLDLSKNTKLKYLYIKGNSIKETNIKLAKNIKLDKVLEGRIIDE